MMDSSVNEVLHREFCMRGELYEEINLKTCLLKLHLNVADLIITSSAFMQTIEATNVLGNATVLNVDTYGFGEPQEEWTNKIVMRANAYPYKRIIAIGGGATIDISKLCVFGDGRSVQELYDNKLRLHKTRELIALPTTCGTGSEVTSVAVVEFPSLNSKLGLQIDALFPDKAILIGELLNSLPYRSYALTSIDALAHAIESLLSPKANPYTDMFARSAIEGIIENMQEIRGENKLPSNLQKSLISANMAGIAFSIAGCATMHALSFPLGAKLHLAHGEAVYAVFAKTLEYYQTKKIALQKLENILSPLFEDVHPIEELIILLSQIYPCPNLKKIGIDETVCDSWAINVYENQQRLLVNSPCLLNSNDLAIIYKNCIV